MRTDPETTRIVRSWLEEGRTALPDYVLDAVLDRIPATPQRRHPWSAWRSHQVNTMLKMALAAAAVVVIVVAGLTFLPREGGVGGPGAAPPRPSVSPSPTPAGSHQVVQMGVAGTGLNGVPALHLTAELPPGWTSSEFAARGDRAGPPDGSAFFVSLVDNTFADPCAHVQQSPKVGSSIAALTTAIGRIPNSTATQPVQTKVGGLDATRIDLTLAHNLPCMPTEFYLWQDSPNADWWALGVDEIISIWILDVKGQRVAIAARSYPGTSSAAQTELRGILDSIRFD
jgi:hypothetical protein